MEVGSVVVIDAEAKIVEVTSSEEEVVEEEMATEEEVVVEPTTEKLTNEEVLTIVQPLFDEFKNAYAELEAKVAELEAKLTEAKKVEEELSTKIETLSKTAGADTITKKDDRSEKQLKNDEFILSRVRAFSKR